MSDEFIDVMRAEMGEGVSIKAGPYLMKNTAERRCDLYNYERAEVI